MTVLFDGWCAVSPRLRVVCWLLWTLALNISAALFLYSTRGAEDAALNAVREANGERWLNLYQIVRSMNAQPVVSVLPMSPFSPLSFQVPNVKLLHWQPSTSGGELAITAPWEAIPSLFAYLAERGMAVRAFSLKAENHTRILTLALEPLHER